MSRKKKKRFPFLVLLCFLLVAAGIAIHIYTPTARIKALENVEIPDWITKDIINIDGTSRSGVPLSDITDIVIHYVGNPSTTAKANRDYFDSVSSTVSSHFVVGLDGEIIQCLPLHERSAASNHRNGDTISIEVCHADDTGKFNEKTYASLVRLTAWLLDECSLSPDHIIRHYDVTGKECPRYFVTHPEAWETFKKDVKAYKGKEVTTE